MLCNQKNTEKCYKDHRQTAGASGRDMLSDQEEQWIWWAEHFRGLFSILLPSARPDKKPAGSPLTHLQVNENKSCKANIKRAIRHLEERKASWPWWKTIKADLNSSTKMQELGNKLVTRYDWKEGYLINPGKKADLKECKNWRCITLLQTVEKAMNRIILQRPRVELDKRLRDEGAGFGRRGHVQITYATLRIIVDLFCLHKLCGLRGPFTVLTRNCCGTCYIIMTSQRCGSPSYTASP